MASEARGGCGHGRCVRLRTQYFGMPCWSLGARPRGRFHARGDATGAARGDTTGDLSDDLRNGGLTCDDTGGDATGDLSDDLREDTRGDATSDLSDDFSYPAVRFRDLGRNFDDSTFKTLSIIDVLPGLSMCLSPWMTNFLVSSVIISQMSMNFEKREYFDGRLLSVFGGSIVYDVFWQAHNGEQMELKRADRQKIQRKRQNAQGSRNPQGSQNLQGSQR